MKTSHASLRFSCFIFWTTWETMC